MTGDTLEGIGGSRGGARGARPPLISESEDPRPPYLKVWITHWKVCDNLKMTTSFLTYSKQYLKIVPLYSSNASRGISPCGFGGKNEFFLRHLITSSLFNGLNHLDQSVLIIITVGTGKKIVKIYIFFLHFIYALFIKRRGQDGWILTKFFFAFLWAKT